MAYITTYIKIKLNENKIKEFPPPRTLQCFHLIELFNEESFALGANLQSIESIHCKYL